MVAWTAPRVAAASVAAFAGWKVFGIFTYNAAPLSNDWLTPQGLRKMNLDIPKMALFAEASYSTKGQTYGDPDSDGWCTFKGTETMTTKYEKVGEDRQIKTPGHFNGTMSYSVFYDPSSSNGVLAFRGTDELEDLFNAISRVGLVKWRVGGKYAGKVGDGFLQHYEGTNGAGADAITKDLKDLRERGMERLALTGHSLGGAVATLVAAEASDLPSTKDIPVSIVTFGSPRVGDRAFVEFYRNLPVDWETTRVVNVENDTKWRLPFTRKELQDPVSMVPGGLWCWLIGYRHVCPARKVDTDLDPTVAVEVIVPPNSPPLHREATYVRATSEAKARGSASD